MSVVVSAIGGAMGGAVMGVAIGYLTHRGEKDRHIGRHLLMGAAAGAALAAVESLSGTSLSVAARLSPEALRQAPSHALRPCPPGQMHDPLSGACMPPEKAFHETMMQLDKSVTPLPILGKAVDGALLGVAIGYLAHRKEGDAKKHLGRHAAMGAGIGAALGLASYFIGKGALTAGNLVSTMVDKKSRHSPATDYILHGGTPPWAAQGAYDYASNGAW